MSRLGMTHMVTQEGVIKGRGHGVDKVNRKGVIKVGGVIFHTPSVHKHKR